MPVGEPSLPKWNETFWPTISALKELGGSGTIQEIDDEVVRQQDYSDAQLAVLHGDGEKSEIAYRLAWARTNLKNLGAVTNSARGVWAITDFGREASAGQLIDLDRQWRRELAAKRAQKLSADAELSDEDGDGGSTEDDWKAILLARLLEMPADAFERLSQRLLREAGFVNVNVTGRSGHGGIDGTGIYRVSPLVSFPTFFQCKRYRGNVAPSQVRDFRGAMAGRGDKGLLITTGIFSKEAQAEATRDGAQPIELINGDRLCDLLKQYDLGVSTEQRVVEDVTVDPSFFDTI